LEDVTGEALRLWRESQGWDVPRMARELRKAARDCGEDVAAHHGLVKMIPQWERGSRVPRERYRLLYLKIFRGEPAVLPRAVRLGTGKRRAEVKRLVAELDVQLSQAEANVAVLRALLAEDGEGSPAEG
jgi:transcriptional regulator with XRE-family HTH domain